MATPDYPYKAHIETPDNSKIDYERAGMLEQAIRDAARKYSYTILDVHIRSDGNSAPEIEIELRQQPGQVSQ